MPSRVSIEEVLSRLHGVRQSGQGNVALCPAHEDSRQSLKVSTGRDGGIVLHCHTGCPPEAVAKAINLTLADLCANGKEAPAPARRIAATYDYTDADGGLLYQAVRYEPKDFRQRRPDGKGGWTWDLKGVERVLYRLPELRGSKATAFIVEGEKDADALAALGLPATSNVGGAGKWLTAYSGELRGRRVVILPDNDEAGRQHAEKVALALSGCASEVYVVNLPGLVEKGDVSDWLKAGGTVDQLRDVVKEAKPWRAAEHGELSNGNGNGAHAVPCAVLQRMSDVRAEKVEWLWPGRIALGKLTVVDGDPGLGKSLVTLDLAARVTLARAMPDGVMGDLLKPCGVVILTAEDGLGDTVRPRLEVLGANLELVIALTGVLQMVPGADPREQMPTIGDLRAIEEAIAAVNARYLLIDPLMAYMPEEVNSNKDQDVRRVLAPLAGLADRTGVAAVVVRHLNKSQISNSLYRGGGSIGIIGAARSGLLIAPDPDDETGRRRIVVVTKCNLAAPVPALSYTVEVLNDQPYASWHTGCSHHTASSLLAQPESREDKPAIQNASEFLEEMLRHGAVLCKDVIKEARAAGISERSLDRAKSAVGIKSRKDGYSGWKWELPMEAP